MLLFTLRAYKIDDKEVKNRESGRILKSPTSHTFTSIWSMMISADIQYSLPRSLNFHTKSSLLSFFSYPCCCWNNQYWHLLKITSMSSSLVSCAYCLFACYYRLSLECDISAIWILLKISLLCYENEIKLPITFKVFFLFLFRSEIKENLRDFFSPLLSTSSCFVIIIIPFISILFGEFEIGSKLLVLCCRNLIFLPFIYRQKMTAITKSL